MPVWDLAGNAWNVMPLEIRQLNNGKVGGERPNCVQRDCYQKVQNFWFKFCHSILQINYVMKVEKIKHQKQWVDGFPPLQVRNSQPDEFWQFQYQNIEFIGTSSKPSRVLASHHIAPCIGWWKNSIITNRHEDQFWN